MSKKYAEIGDRLNTFCSEHFKSRREFALALGMSYEALTNYITGQVQPGNKLQTKLRALGCDIDWLMTGRGSTEIHTNEALAEAERRNIAAEDLEILQVLKSGGIDTPNKARALLQRDRTVRELYSGESNVVQSSGNAGTADTKDPVKLTFIKKPSPQHKEHHSK